MQIYEFKKGEVLNITPFYLYICTHLTFRACRVIDFEEAVEECTNSPSV